MSDTIWIGQEVQLTFSLKRLVNGVLTLTDPTACTLTVQTPGGTVTDYVWPGDGAISHPSLGVLVWTAVADSAGTWPWRAETDTHTVGEGSFRVSASKITG